jgi:hypothetical protein
MAAKENHEKPGQAQAAAAFSPAAAYPESRNPEAEAEEEAAAAAKKRRRLREEANAAAAARAQTAEARPAPGAAQPQSVREWLREFWGGSVECGPDVWDCGDEIRLKFLIKNGGPGQEQIEAMVRQALQKGWTEIYLYSKGQPHLQLAAQVRQTMLAMGVPEDRLRCCDDPAAYQRRALEASAPVPA